MENSPKNFKSNLVLDLFPQRFKVWLISALAILISISGLISSSLNPSIGFPLRPGLDFTGGTQIKLERKCYESCNTINSLEISNALDKLVLPRGNENNAPNLSGSKVQVLEDYRFLVLRMPFLSATQSQVVIDRMREFIGPLEIDGQSINTIGPTLGSQLLKSSLISLCVALIAISFYISIRFDRQFAILALLALSHDVIIVCGIFAWLGIFINLEVNSLFAVALLTISGYSVNDTVVVFDRIREITKIQPGLSHRDKIGIAVSSTLTRTLYTSATTLLPLIALILWGGATLYWFAVALAVGVLIGSWSSIALAPSLLYLRKEL